MRQLVELHDHLTAFEDLDADIVAIAQKETDPDKLARIEALVGDGITFVCDPQGASSMFSLFGTFLIDSEGIIRRGMPGSKEARARTDAILSELAEVAGKDAPEMHYEDGKLAIVNSDTFTPGDVAEGVLDASWAFSHDRFAPGKTTKLMFLPEIAPQWKVYAPGSALMAPLAIEVHLPKGLTLAEPLVFPQPLTERDDVLETELSYYEHDIPVTALVFAMEDDFAASEATVSIAVTYQACRGSLCLPPETQHFEMTLPVGSSSERRGQLYNWQTW